MKQKNKKQIEANLRNKMASQYKAKVDILEKQLETSRESNLKLHGYNSELRLENDELKEKIRQYEDWIQRLQEFMDMNDDDREAYKETLRAKEELKHAIEGTKMYGYLNHLFGLMI